MLLLPVVVGLADLVAAQNPSPSTTTETLAQRCVTNSGPSSRLVLETRTRTPALTTRVVISRSNPETNISSVLTQMADYIDT